MEMTAIKLAAKTIELWPEPIEPGSPRRSRRPKMSGRCSAAGGPRAASSCSGGRAALCARSPPAAPAGRPPTIFERDGDGWRAASGRERGERLRVDGERLIWAGYPFTRAQEPFLGA